MPDRQIVLQLIIEQCVRPVSEFKGGYVQKIATIQAIAEAALAAGPSHETKRAEYIERLNTSTQALRERVRQSECITAEDLAKQVAAGPIPPPHKETPNPPSSALEEILAKLAAGPIQPANEPANYPPLFWQHLQNELVEAHQALDKLAAPRTREVWNRNVTDKQPITIGLRERILSLAAGPSHQPEEKETSE